MDCNSVFSLATSVTTCLSSLQTKHGNIGAWGENAYVDNYGQSRHPWRLVGAMAAAMSLSDDAMIHCRDKVKVCSSSADRPSIRFP